MNCDSWGFLGIRLKLFLRSLRSQKAATATLNLGGLSGRGGVEQSSLRCGAPAPARGKFASRNRETKNREPNKRTKQPDPQLDRISVEQRPAPKRWRAPGRVCGVLAVSDTSNAAFSLPVSKNRLGGGGGGKCSGVFCVFGVTGTFWVVDIGGFRK